MIETTDMTQQTLQESLKSLPPVILASGSPRRKELLSSLGIRFEVIKPGVDEEAQDIDHLSPREQAVTLARLKGQEVAQHHPDSLVIAADTIVMVNNQLLGKPADREDAFRMLSTLQGTTHSVFSGIAIYYQCLEQADALETRVTMRSLSPEAIWTYIDTGEPMDKAGAYAIQGYGSLLVEKIDGCYFNVVGMSLVLLDKLCKDLGITLVF